MVSQDVTYYGIHLVHASEIWAGVTYHTLLVQSYPSEYLVSTASTQASSVDFLYPRLIQSRFYLDGVAEGHITLYNTDSGSSATVNSITVTLYKSRDVPGYLETVGSYTRSYTDDNIIGPGDYLTLPVYMTIEHDNGGLVDPGMKLILRVAHSSSSSAVAICHANISEDEDLRLSLPYASQGG